MLAPLLCTRLRSKVHLLRSIASIADKDPEVGRIAALLQKCSKGKALSEGRQVHVYIGQSGLHGDTFLGNLLVQMYGSCGSIDDARTAFECIHHRNVFSWNLMIGAYVENGHLEDAKRTFHGMPLQDAVAWNTMISAYAQNGDFEEARWLFDRMPQQNVVSWTSMIGTYAHNGHMEEARSMFVKMPQRNEVSWNALVIAYAQTGLLQDGRDLLEKMPQWDTVSWNALISANAKNGKLREAESMFEKMPQRDVVTCTAMINAYAVHGHLVEARSIFDSMHDQTVVSWTVMITAYAQNGLCENARSTFDTMPHRNVVSWNAMISAYAQHGHAQHGHLDHARSMFERLPQQSVSSWTMMIQANAVNGELQEAKTMFDKMPERDVVSWNAMIAAYAQQGQGKEACLLFSMMDLEAQKPNVITFVTVIDACATVGAIGEAKLIHASLLGRVFQSNTSVMNALINLYGRCGKLGEAWSVFCEMVKHDVVSWSAIIAAYAQNGRGKYALELFQAMNLEGMKPDVIIFVSIISACSHEGLVDDGWRFFVSLSRDYGISTTVNHYMCMIDLLCRAGQLNEAEDLINNMPFEADEVAWMTLLGACRSYSDAKRGARAAEGALETEPGNAAPYLLVSSIQ